jgi:serine protease AprX
MSIREPVRVSDKRSNLVLPLRRRLRVAVPALLAATLSVGGAVASVAATASASSAATPAHRAPTAHPAHAAHLAHAPASGAREVLVSGSPGAVAHGEALVSHGAGYAELPVVGGFSAKVSPAQRAQLVALGLRVSANAAMHVTDADWGAGSHDASAVYPQVDGATDAWSKGITGSGVSVAVVDTGIDDTGDLAGKVIDGYDFSGEGSYTTDSFGHGTFVAGIIAGSGAASNGAIKGVAPGVKLVSLKVAGADGSTDVIRVISAIQWAVNHAAADHIRVLNLSLGTDSTQSWRIDPLDAAVEGAWRAGIVVTVAAGNNGSGSISKPGDDPYVLTVGSSDDATTPGTSDDTIASFSGTGPTAAGIAKPDLVAPGTHVVSTRAPGSTVDTTYPEARIDPIYFRGSGTSFSAPQAAGAAALLLQQRPGLTNNQVKALLTSTATPLAGVPSTAQGAGELNVKAALAASATRSANGGLASSTGSGSPASSEGSLLLGGKPLGGDSVAWNSVAWNSVAWNSVAWNAAAWNSVAWNSVAWNSVAWNSVAWNSVAWNSVAWNSVAWNSVAWNASGWASANFWSVAWN